MTKPETIAALRALADKLEASDIDPPEVRLSWHHVYTREKLAAIVGLMNEPRCDRKSGTHWVNGFICGFRSTAFYLTGLLGKTRKKTVVEVEVEPDLAGLMNQ